MYSKICISVTEGELQRWNKKALKAELLNAIKSSFHMSNEPMVFSVFTILLYSPTVNKQILQQTK